VPATALGSLSCHRLAGCRTNDAGPKSQARFLIPEPFLTNVGIGGAILHFSPKQIIFSQGARADAVLYIQDGTARLSVVSKQGREATIALLGPGDFLGEGSIASDQPFQMTTAIATTRCSVLKIAKREMLRTLHEEHKFSDMFVA
jgi:CRP/FNR family cyclic AMP-dependent transcriptional regulator